MSLFNRMLSSVGIGAAKVDTLLQAERFCPGDMMNGIVRITGGNVEQRIDDIYFTVHCNYLVEQDEQKIDRTATLAHYKLSEGLTIAPGEQRELPIALQLPWETPLTMGRTRVWVSTGLDIKQSLDPADNDYIQVVPGRLVSALLEAVRNLGFRLVEAETEAAPTGFRRGLPF
ncbi:MAG: sporulation protein, partial [Candidatus Competibacteraceae bacterium]|nr:sporulation protein [Candidatus Competibacteraceae bacterium]